MLGIIDIYWSADCSKIQTEILKENDNPESIGTHKIIQFFEVNNFSRENINKYIQTPFSDTSYEEISASDIIKREKKKIKDLGFSGKRFFCRMPHITIYTSNDGFKVSINMAYKKDTNCTITCFSPEPLIQIKDVPEIIESLIPLLKIIHGLCLEKSFDDDEKLKKYMKKKGIYEELSRKYPLFLN